MYNNFHGEFTDAEGKVRLDLVLRSYFPDYEYKGVMLDIGAYHPIQNNNSYHFEKNGWDTYCFEANSLMLPSLNKERGKVLNFAISDEDNKDIEFNVVRSINGSYAGMSAIDVDPMMAEKFKNWVEETIKVKALTRTLDNIMSKELSSVDKIDIISLDVEGGEYNVLKGFDLNKWKPKVLLVENYFNKNNLDEYIKGHGYKLDKKFNADEFYIRES